MAQNKNRHLGNSQQKNNSDQRIIVQIQRAEMVHSGPLPPASEVGKYVDIYPQAAEMIFKYAEKEQNFRHNHVNKQ